MASADDKKAAAQETVSLRNACDGVDNNDIKKPKPGECF